MAANEAGIDKRALDFLNLTTLWRCEKWPHGYDAGESRVQAPQSK